MLATPQTVDEYLAPLSKEKRAALEKLRRAIKSAAPEAMECISYGIPAYRLGGRLLVAFGTATNHCAFYPGAFPVQSHRAALKAYKTSKGTIRFQVDRPLPATLVQKLVKARVGEHATRRPVRAKRTGKTTTQAQVLCHKDGSVWARGQTLDGAAAGYWEWFRKDGVRMRSGYFEKGEQTGAWTTYDKLGDVYKVTIMKRKAK